MENLPEYKKVADDDGRRAAFAKFVKRQKVSHSPPKFITFIKAGLRNVYEKQRLKMALLPPVANAKSLHQSTKRIKIRAVTATATAIVIANGNGSAIRTHDAEYDGGHGHRSSHRDYKERDKDYTAAREEKDREYSRPPKHHDREDGRKRERERDRERKGREWDDVPRGIGRDRSVSVRGEDRIHDERAEKVLLFILSVRCNPN
jgi:pre-mRNA-processing factor 40